MFDRELLTGWIDSDNLPVQLEVLRLAPASGRAAASATIAAGDRAKADQSPWDARSASL